MFLSLIRRFRSEEPLHALDTPGGLYIDGFKVSIKRIARALSPKSVSAHFVAIDRHVEFRCPDGQVLAILAVHGEMCTPTTAYVSPCDLSDYARACFLRELSTLTVEFVELEQRPAYRWRQRARAA